MLYQKLCYNEPCYKDASTFEVPGKLCSKQHSVFFFFLLFTEKEKIGPGMSCELSAKQTIHMSRQFSLNKKKKKIIKMSSAAVVIGALKFTLTML